MEKHKDVVKKLTICIVLLSLIWGCYYFASRAISKTTTVIEDDFSWAYQVDSAEILGKRLILEGFAFQLKHDAISGGYEIVLSDLDSGKTVFAEMEYTNREDVNKYFLCEYDYLCSGFQATVSINKVDILEKDYEVLLRVTDKKMAYRTGIYLSDGKIMFANPTTFVSPEVEGTDIENIVRQGALRVYRPDIGAYVYQYEGSLYWIAEQSYALTESTIIQYQLDTTQINRLPNRRLQKQLDWDNISFKFCDKELTEGDYGKYRVAKAKIPEEYSVEKIWTGYYMDEWLWKEYFRPIYMFEN